MGSTNGTHGRGNDSPLGEYLFFANRQDSVLRTTRADTTNKPALVKSPTLREIPVLWRIYEGLTIRRRDSRVDQWIERDQESIRKKYSAGSWRESPPFSGYVRLHDRYCQTGGMESSSERIVDFILKRGSVPNINTFVDTYNLVSGLTGISIGAHDLSKIEGNVRLEVLSADTRFEVVGGGRYDTARKGEYSYVDDKGILCKLDIKQAERTKITEKTHDVFVIFQGHGHLGEEALMEGVRLLDERMKRGAI
jgi:DNA/RNA-binding domain of Phe-tRNA-synthetase-like protein